MTPSRFKCVSIVEVLISIGLVIILLFVVLLILGLAGLFLFAIGWVLNGLWELFFVPIFGVHPGVIFFTIVAYILITICKEIYVLMKRSASRTTEPNR